MSAKLGGDALASPSTSSSTTKIIEDASSSLPNPAHKLFLPEPLTEAAVASAPADKDATGDTNTSPSSSSLTSSPLVICFHGSGESCSPSWDALARALTAAPLRLRVLAFERGEDNPKPPRATADLLAYLAAGGEATKPPYVLVAHSYGGAFARTFLEEEAPREQVAGVVLVETGQEGGLDAGVEEAQYRRRVLGRRPLSVVRGNSLMGVEAQIAELEARAATAKTAASEVEMQGLRGRREMLKAWDEEDERLKKRQLDLSERTARKRYVHVPDCGHHVVRDRPDVVAKEVAWVVENMGRGDEAGEGEDGGGEGEDDGEAERGEKGWEKIRRIWKGMFGMLFGRLKGLR
ncbi:Alpha/Beta hydrolase protein [Hypoxylon rubiginosum]|uniref:Alpha/Beta hydrolase protein n=1 Tax=Hypoxylon rubiginosum TaxID=110542 RepID=A0ACB9YL13_9PEZI|nr:Alpha/Beta hydrolase protein [Hypoxylon rubiginosum]